MNIEEFEKKVLQFPAHFGLDDYFDLVNKRNNRLKRLIKIEAPKVIVNEEKRMLREAVDKLLTYLDKKEENYGHLPNVAKSWRPSLFQPA